MASLRRRLPRGLAKVQCAFGSATHLERNISSLSVTISGARAEEYSSECLNSSTEVRQSTTGGNRVQDPITHPYDMSRLSDLRFEASCCSSWERSSVSSRFMAKPQDFLRNGASMFLDENLRSIKFRPSPPPYRMRSMWTAASTEDKLRSQVDDEEPDAKTIEDKGVTTIGKQKVRKGGEGAGEEEVVESSMYTSAESPSQLTDADVNKFYTLSPQDREQYFGEGLPAGVLKEFEETKESSLMIRARVLQLFERFHKYQEDIVRLKDKGQAVRPLAPKLRQCLLEGLNKGGKSVALAMLVHWARTRGWLVFYVPSAREWTTVGFYYKNDNTGLWDTPVQAKTALEGFLKSHGSILGEIPCRILTPLQLGEGAGTGKARGPQQISLCEGATLRDLVQKGIALSQAAVSAVLRLREELNLVEELPVLIAVDEFNCWFTFSGYYESTGTRSRRPIHACELSMVHAFRTMTGPLMMATAYSNSLAVGRLPVSLPGVPKGSRFNIPRYSLEEARAALEYYHSRKVTSKEDLTEEDVRKLYFLTNGNGEELRTLVRIL